MSDQPEKKYGRRDGSNVARAAASQRGGDPFERVAAISTVVLVLAAAILLAARSQRDTTALQDRVLRAIIGV